MCKVQRSPLHRFRRGFALIILIRFFFFPSKKNSFWVRYTAAAATPPRVQGVQTVTDQLGFPLLLLLLICLSLPYFLFTKQ